MEENNNLLRELPSEMKARMERHAASIRSCPFTVLIWGPGESAKESYEKRIKIREHISNVFGLENVLMSEDSVFDPYNEEFGVKLSEEMQVTAVDGVIILDTSVGPHTELTAFEDSLHTKTRVFAPKEFDNASFAATSYKLINPDFYTEEEFDKCRVIRDKSLEFLNALRLRKWRKISSQQLS